MEVRKKKRAWAWVLPGRRAARMRKRKVQLVGVVGSKCDRVHRAESPWIDGRLTSGPGGQTGRSGRGREGGRAEWKVTAMIEVLLAEWEIGGDFAPAGRGLGVGEV